MQNIHELKEESQFETPPKEAISEWDEALQLAGISSPPTFSFGKENTQLSMIQRYTRLPTELTKIIGEYATFQIDLMKAVQGGIITRENFWEAVVGFCAIHTCFPFQVPGAPPLSLVSDKIKKGEASGLVYLETWGAAILLYMAKSLHVAENKDEDQPNRYGKHPFFTASGKSGYDNQEEVNDPYLASLEKLLHDTAGLAENMLSYEEVACVVHHYPRLQSVFISGLLANTPSISPLTETLIAQWMPDNTRAQQTLSVFQLLRVINRALFRSNVTLDTLKSITPFQHFLQRYQLDHIEDPKLFCKTVCLCAHEFLDPSLPTLTSPETNTSIVLTSVKTADTFDQQFKTYCLQKENVPEGYTIFQYILMGTSVDGETLGHLISIGHIQAIRLLLQIPELDVNAYYDTKDSCLMMAAESGHTQIVELFLRHPDIYVNQPCGTEPYDGYDEYGPDYSYYTALTCAVNKSHVEVVRLLVERPETDIAQGVEGIRQTPYAIISLLFQALNTRSVSDELIGELLGGLHTNDLRVIAAAIAPDLQRFGSIALGVYINEPRAVKFLSRIPRLSGDYALVKLISRELDDDRNRTHYSTRSDGTYFCSKNSITLQQLFDATEITTPAIHAALFALLNIRIESYEKEKIEKIIEALALLFSQPGIDIYYEGVATPRGATYFFHRSSNDSDLQTYAFNYVKPKKESLLSLAAKHPKYLRCLIEHAPLDSKSIQADEALISAVASSNYFSSYQEKLETIQYLLTFAQVTPHAIHIALFSLLRDYGQSAEKLQLLSLLFMQPGVDVNAEDLSKPQRHGWMMAEEKSDADKPVKKDSLLRLVSRQASYLWCLAEHPSMNLQSLNGDAALLNATRSMALADIQKLLTCTHITQAGIHKALYSLLSTERVAEEKLRVLTLLFTQPGVDIYQENIAEKSGTSYTLLHLASQKADYLWCLTECLGVDLLTINGDQALITAVSTESHYRNHENDVRMLDTVQQLLTRTHITAEGAYTALTIVLRSKPSSKERVQILELLLSKQPEVDIYQERVLEEVVIRGRDHYGDCYGGGYGSDDDGETKKTVQKDSLLGLALKQPAYLFCMADYLKLDTRTINADQALEHALAPYQEDQDTAQQLLTRTQITLEGVYKALFRLLCRGFCATRTLEILSLLLTQPGIDIYKEDTSESNDNWPFGPSRKNATKDTLLSLILKQPAYIDCVTQSLGIDFHNINADAALLNIVLNGGREKEVIEKIQQLLSRTLITPDGIHAALFLLLNTPFPERRSHHESSDTKNLELIKLLLKQPGVNLHAEDPSRKKTLLDLFLREPNYLWCLAEYPGINLRTIHTDQIFLAVISARLGYSSSDQKPLEKFNTIQQLLARTHVTIESIHEALFILLRSRDTNAETLQIISFLLAQPGVDIHQKNIKKVRTARHQWHTRETIQEDTLLSLASKNASYLWCLAECPGVNLKDVNGDEALKEIIPYIAEYGLSKDYKNTCKNTVIQLLARTTITLKGIYAALFMLLRNRDLFGNKNEVACSVCELLLKQPGVNIYQEYRFTPTHHSNYRYEVEDNEDGQDAKRVPKKTRLLDLATKQIDLLFFISEHFGVETSHINGDQALKDTVSFYANPEMALETTQRLLAATDITPKGIYGALSSLFSSSSYKFKELSTRFKFIELLVSQPGIDLQHKFLMHPNCSVADPVEDESILEFIARTPIYLPALIKRPEINAPLVCSRLDVLIQERAQMVKTIVLPPKKSYEPELVDLCLLRTQMHLLDENQIMSSIETIRAEDIQMMVCLEKAMLLKPSPDGSYLIDTSMLPKKEQRTANEPPVDEAPAETKQSPSEEELSQENQAHEASAENKQDVIEDKHEGGEPAKTREGSSQENNDQRGDEPEAKAETETPLTRCFWQAKKQQSNLLQQMRALLQSPFLKREHVTALVEKAAAAGFEDVVEVLKEAPCMQMSIVDPLQAPPETVAFFGQPQVQTPASAASAQAHR